MVEKRGRPPKDIKKKIDRYKREPALWLYDTFGVELWETQEEILNSVFNNRRTAVKSCYGSGKCLDVDERIVLADGSLVRAGDLIGKGIFQILGFDATADTQQAQPAWATYNGIEDVYEVVTTSGRRIKRTAEHPLLNHTFVYEKTAGTTKLMPYGDPCWVPVKHLKVDDTVLVPEVLHIAGVEEISDDEVRLLGYLLGDGDLTQNQDEFISIVKGMGCKVVKNGEYGMTVRPIKHGCYNFVLEKCKEWGILGSKNINKKFPDFVWRLSNRQLAILLNRVFSCNGWVHSTERGRYVAQIAIRSASEEFIEDIRMALLRLGISGSVRHRKVSYDSEQESDVWEWSCSDCRNIERFASLVNIYGKERRVEECLQHASNRAGLDNYDWRYAGCPTGYKWEKIKEIRNLGPRSTVSISVENTNAFVTSFVEHNSYVAGAIATAFVHLNPNSLVITTAPSHRQLQNIWTPIYQMMEQPKAALGSRVLQHKIQCGPGWEAMGFTTDVPERIQGFHAEKVLIIVDESAGIDPEIHKRLDALMVGEFCHRLDIGNPHEPSGPFHDLFHRDDVNQFTISAFDTPNVIAEKELIPGLITRTWIEERRAEYGEGSPMWKVEVLGEFPPSGEEQLIPIQWVKAAQDRWEESRIANDVPVHGVDPGGGGLSETVLCSRTGNFVHPLKAWQGLSGPEMIQNIKKHTGPRDAIFIDSVGVGYSVVGYARDADLYAQGVNVAEVPMSESERFLNLRAELYWRLREALDPDGNILLALPPDSKLSGQLSAIKYKLNAKGKIQIESKEDMKKRGLPSPDRADALALTLMQHTGDLMVPGEIGGRGLSSYYEEDSLWKGSDYIEWHEYYH